MIVGNSGGIRRNKVTIPATETDLVSTERRYIVVVVRNEVAVPIAKRDCVIGYFYLTSIDSPPPTTNLVVCVPVPVACAVCVIVRTIGAT
jgi:hypothetical protein